MATKRQRTAAEDAAVQKDPSLDANHCGGCGGVYRYDTSIPSVVWNRVVRARGGSELLCAACIIDIFAQCGQSFTARLSSETHDGTLIDVRINGAEARAAEEIQDENNKLRRQVRQLEDAPRRRRKAYRA